MNIVLYVFPKLPNRTSRTSQHVCVYELNEIQPIVKGSILQVVKLAALVDIVLPQQILLNQGCTFHFKKFSCIRHCGTCVRALAFECTLNECVK